MYVVIVTGVISLTSNVYVFDAGEYFVSPRYFTSTLCFPAGKLNVNKHSPFVNAFVSNVLPLFIIATLPVALVLSVPFTITLNVVLDVVFLRMYVVIVTGTLSFTFTVYTLVLLLYILFPRYFTVIFCFPAGNLNVNKHSPFVNAFVSNVLPLFIIATLPFTVDLSALDTITLNVVFEVKEFRMYVVIPVWTLDTSNVYALDAAL